MNRRSFIRMLGLGAAGSFIDPSGLIDLYQDRPRVIYFDLGRSRNRLLTPQWVTRDALQMFTNGLDEVNRLDVLYGFGSLNKGIVFGSTIDIIEPAIYVNDERSGIRMRLVDKFVPVTLDVQRGIDISFDIQDSLLGIGRTGN